MKLGSLCTGIGGLDLAVEAHFGARTVWYSEVEPSVLPVLEREWPGVPNLGDLKLIDWAAVEPVDILTAGYPCQPFSHAGRPAPTPKVDGKLSPAFVEWMQGYPEGWVDGLVRTKALKALGNAVVPQQALAALRILTTEVPA